MNLHRAAWPAARRIALVSDTHGHLDPAVLVTDWEVQEYLRLY